jgi:hypothetical protein
MKKETFFGLLVLFLGFSACQQPMRGTAQEAVPEDKVAKIIAEIALADGAVSALSGFKHDSFVHAYYKQIYEINGITLEEYEKYLRILANDTERLEGVVKKAEQYLKDKQPATNTQDSIPKR